MDRIETKRYAPVVWSDRPQYAGQRRAIDVFEDLFQELEQRGMLPDGYFRASRKIEQEPEIEFPDMLEVLNQYSRHKDGTYLNVHIYICDRDAERCSVFPLAVGKIKDGSEEGHEAMEEIADCIYQLLMGHREGHMTFRDAMKKIYLPSLTLLHPTDEYGNWVVDIEFYNSDHDHDCTQFGVNPCYLDYLNGKCEELEEMWKDFCRCNGFRQNSIIRISVGYPEKWWEEQYEKECA